MTSSVAIRFWCVLGMIGAGALAQVRNCDCDPSRPETLAKRWCSLCVEAERQPQQPFVFFLKDVNPRKANRMLALPRVHGPRQHSLAVMSAEQRTAFWTAAIAKARELWGDAWGLAMNGDEVRTQCHAHVHIGKLIDGLETAALVVVDGPAQIPAPDDGGGFWVHGAEGGKLHVHVGEQIAETVLLR